MYFCSSYLFYLLQALCIHIKYSNFINPLHFIYFCKTLIYLYSSIYNIEEKKECMTCIFLYLYFYIKKPKNIKLITRSLLLIFYNI